jgi:hypothetical protein
MNFHRLDPWGRLFPSQTIGASDRFEPRRYPAAGRNQRNRLAVGESAEFRRELVEVTQFNWPFDFDDAAAFRFDSRAIGRRRSDDHECQPDDREPFHDITSIRLGLFHLARLICRSFSFRHCSKAHLDVAADQHGSFNAAIRSLFRYPLPCAPNMVAGS